jgi:nucleotide-binding universal stress UspA family protein
MIALKRILVPHDFSETSASAVTYAVALAKTFGAALTFLYVRDRTQTGLENEISLVEDGVIEKEARDRLLRILSPADQAALNPEVSVRTGLPAAEIVRFAREDETDLIVLGTHGRGFVGHMVMGSVAEKVVRTAPCPVLTVRRDGAVAQGVYVVDSAVAAVAAV